MQTRNLIGGDWVGAESGREFEVRDPATDEVIARVPDCGAAETKRAVDAAAEAFERWRRVLPFERAEILRRLSDFLLRDQERLALLMTREQGKPLSEARGEIAYSASFIEWAAGEAVRLYGDIIAASKPGKRILALREPVGVCAAITPWNFPSAMLGRKMGPALAAGCTMVIKPAEATPLSAIALGELALEAGVPAGVVNIVTGDAATIGDAIFDAWRVRKVSFTGSTEVGKMLIEKSAKNVTRLSLELGGHAPFIAFDDCDVEAAVQGLIASKFRNAGQTCICPNRVFVQEGIWEKFLATLTPVVQALKVGRGTDEGVEIGPLIDEDGLAKVERHVADAIEKGATLVTGGRRARPGKGLADRFYEPTILTDCTGDMLCWHEETFGPVLPLQRFSREEEAIERANDSPYGLASYFYTRDASRLLRVAEGLQYGIVGANDGAPSTAQAPFGGVKESGYGREGGKYAMEEYTSVKYVSWGV